MKILITGTAGFIGFSLAKELLKDKKNRIYGIDNFDAYYSINLKKKMSKKMFPTRKSKRKSKRKPKKKTSKKRMKGGS